MIESEKKKNNLPEKKWKKNKKEKEKKKGRKIFSLLSNDDLDLLCCSFMKFKI